MPMVRRRMGFTLIELLVVIAIIAILAAILFPVFARAKARAQLVTCIDNLKQWDMAMLQYMGDCNDKFPFAGSDSYYYHPVNKIGGSVTFCQAMWKGGYVKNKGILWCPLWLGSNYTATRSQLGWSYFYLCPHDANSTAANPLTNPWVAVQNHGKAALCGHAMGEVKKPSGKPSIMEIWTRHETDNNDRNSGNGQCLFPMAYCDGHVVVRRYERQMDDITREVYVGRDGSPNE